MVGTAFDQLKGHRATAVTTNRLSVNIRSLLLAAILLMVQTNAQAKAFSCSEKSVNQDNSRLRKLEGDTRIYQNQIRDIDRDIPMIASRDVQIMLYCEDHEGILPLSPSISRCMYRNRNLKIPSSSEIAKKWLSKNWPNEPNNSAKDWSAHTIQAILDIRQRTAKRYLDAITQSLSLLQNLQACDQIKLNDETKRVQELAEHPPKSLVAADDAGSGRN